MNPTHRSKVILNLDIGARWLNTIPHDINAIVAELHRQARASASLGSGSDGRAPKGSHSDPTGGAVVTMADAIARADEETREIDAALALLDETMAWLLAKCGTIQRAGLRPPDEPAPVQKPLRGCASCARDNGHFEAIATDRYANLCRPCGQYKAAEGRLPPLGAVEYMHRYGKLTPKAIADGLRAEKAKRTSPRKAG